MLPSTLCFQARMTAPPRLEAVTLCPRQNIDLIGVHPMPRQQSAGSAYGRFVHLTLFPHAISDMWLAREVVIAGSTKVGPSKDWRHQNRLPKILPRGCKVISINVRPCYSLLGTELVCCIPGTLAHQQEWHASTGIQGRRMFIASPKGHSTSVLNDATQEAFEATWTEDWEGLGSTLCMGYFARSDVAEHGHGCHT